MRRVNVKGTSGSGKSIFVGAGAGWTPTPRLVRETADRDARRGLWMGQVTISRENASLFMFPTIDPGPLRDERDVEVLVNGFEQLRELATSEPIALYAEAEARPGPGFDAEEHVRATARGFFHPVATCAIGRVADERCRVLGFENLYVVDASAVPTIPRANTHLTTVALAERAAEWI